MSVLAAVHHAEVVAHRTGEPFGTLILAIAVTIIEASMILSMMASGPASATLPRDTVYAAIMLILNGLVGLCLLVSGIRHREPYFVGSEEHTSELQSLMRISYAVLCLKKTSMN